jgi:carbamoyl-phosphate synthase large subunit
MKNILITSAGKRVVLVQIFQQTLKDMGLEAKVYTTDMKPMMAPACIVSDEGIKVSPCKAEGYIDELIQICQDKKIGAIIPTIDPELLALAKNRQRFSEIGVEIVLSDEAFIKACRDKRETQQYLQNIGIDVPKAVDKYHPTFPMFVKPYDGSLSRDIHVVHNQRELTQDMLENPKFMFMEYLDQHEYKEYSVDMYFGKDHCVKGIVPRERIEVRAGEINKGKTHKNEIVDFLKDKMGCLPGVRGCICFQLFYRESDHSIKGSEINPRFGGGFPLTYHAKANYAAYIIKEYLLHETVDYSDAWLDNTLMLRYDNDIIIYNAK